jgi:hypothetical protein
MVVAGRHPTRSVSVIGTRASATTHSNTPRGAVLSPLSTQHAGRALLHRAPRRASLHSTLALEPRGRRIGASSLNRRRVCQRSALTVNLRPHDNNGSRATASTESLQARETHHSPPTLSYTDDDSARPRHAVSTPPGARRRSLAPAHSCRLFLHAQSPDHAAFTGGFAQ